MPLLFWTRTKALRTAEVASGTIAAATAQQSHQQDTRRDSSSGIHKQVQWRKDKDALDLTDEPGGRTEGPPEAEVRVSELAVALETERTSFGMAMLDRQLLAAAGSAHEVTLNRVHARLPCVMYKTRDALTCRCTIREVWDGHS